MREHFNRESNYDSVVHNYVNNLYTFISPSDKIIAKEKQQITEWHVHPANQKHTKI